jgi:hypothetical protein
VNEVHRRTSGAVQCGERKPCPKIGAVSKSSQRNRAEEHGNKKENAMLKTFTAALLATTLIAAPAFAQNPTNTGATPAAPAAQSQPASSAGKAAQTDLGKTDLGKSAAKTTTHKTAKHVAKHASKHASRGKTKTVHQARHVKPGKTHQVNAGKPMSETAKHS